MAEKLVSPGVFTRENDLSFLQQGVAEIGAAFVGPFKEGPVVPTIVNTQSQFQTLFGTVDDTYYTGLAVQNYLREAGTATICRVAGVGGYTELQPLLLTLTTGGVSASVAVLYNTDKNTLTTGLSGSSVTSLGHGDFNLFTTSSTTLTQFSGAASLDPTDPNNIVSIFGESAIGSKGAYVYSYFKSHGIAYEAGTTVQLVQLASQAYTVDAVEAMTPMIQSQLISGERHDLFKFETLGVGNTTNKKVKISLSNIKPAGSVAGSDYGSFTVTVRSYDDTDKKKNVLESFANVNLDPNSPNFISRVIGDRKLSIGNDGKITEMGDWVNNSMYIRVSSLNMNAPVQCVPYGHTAYSLPISASAQYINTIPTVSYQTGSAQYHGGIILDNSSNVWSLHKVEDNKLYNVPLPSGVGVGVNTAFGLDAVNGGNLELTGSAAVDTAKRQFTIAFQGGFDGMSPATPINKGADIVAGNTQGFNCSTSLSAGTIAYTRAIAALSNSDEWDINMVVAPGITKNDHSSVFQSIVDMVEQRADAFFIGEMGNSALGLGATVTAASTLDSNYVGTYYPWVKTIDVNTNKLITVPPSVLLPAVYAANDRVAAEWFAPAGLNRGGLVGAVAVMNRLTHSERDTLYEGKVNPIAQFPGQGIVVFGQKTLQDKPSALDRINVRRLLLVVRKYIASTSRYLVFEQNSSTTRNRFLNVVNPYLEGIQQRQGLYAFKVVMDESNNTPDVIDRNILKGSIYLQPTKTAEFIQIDFNILPTGGVFSG
jgi:hypothetical protein